MLRIADRVAELGFQTTFLREMRALAAMKQRMKYRVWLQSKIARRVRNLRLYRLEPERGLIACTGAVSWILAETSCWRCRKEVNRTCKAGWIGMACIWVARNCDLEAEFL